MDTSRRDVPDTACDDGGAEYDGDWPCVPLHMISHPVVTGSIDRAVVLSSAAAAAQLCEKLKVGNWTRTVRASIRPALRRTKRDQAQVAQLVEQRIENPRVGGSIPPLGTTYLL